jgi:hypothetical protein
MRDEIDRAWLKRGLHSIASVLPEMEAEGFVFGRWPEAGEVTPGLYPIQSYELGEAGQTLFDAVYDTGWVRADFDWGMWMNTEEAIRLREDQEYLAQASPEQLSKLLTVLFRQERFCDGALESAYGSGLLVRILRRVAALEAELAKEGA